METKDIEVFSDVSNNAIVRMPSRRFPGVVIQGDSLSILFSAAMKLVESLEGAENTEAFLTALEIAEELESRLDHYESVLETHQISPPYSRDKSRSTTKYAPRWEK